MGRERLQADLRGSASLKEGVERVRTFAADHPDHRWLVGRGWNQVLWPENRFPTARDLDAVIADRPSYWRGSMATPSGSTLRRCARPASRLRRKIRPVGNCARRRRSSERRVRRCRHAAHRAPCAGADRQGSEKRAQRRNARTCRTGRHRRARRWDRRTAVSRLSSAGRRKRAANSHLRHVGGQ